MKQQRFALLLVAAILTGLLPIRVMAVTEEVDGQASSAVQPLDELTFPLTGDEELSVTWKNDGGDVIYRYDNKEDPIETGSLVNLPTGTYLVSLSVKEEGVGLLPGNRYILDLPSVMQWPPDTGSVTISFPDEDGDGWFEMIDDSGGWEVRFGRLKVTDDGTFILELYQNDHANLDTWLTHFEFTINYKGSGDSALPVSVQKTGYFNPETDRIDWSVNALIPAYTGGGCHTWSIDDSLNYNKHIGVIPDTWEDVKIMAESGAFTGEVFPVDTASESAVLAYQLLITGENEKRVCLLNRCLCDEETCRNWGNSGCGSRLADTNWCTCWSYPYNTEFILAFSMDVSVLLQGLVDLSASDKSDVENSAYVCQDGTTLRFSSAVVQLMVPIRKTEIGRPMNQNDFAGTYTVTVNPDGFYDYSQMDSLTVCDTMTNLGYVEGSLSVSGGERDWILVTEESQVPDKREGNEDRYYSIRCGEPEKTDGGFLQSMVQFTIWYPTDLAYTLTYQAFVLDPEAGSTNGYSNTAAVGKVQTQISGTNEKPTGGSAVTMKNLYISKVDAETREPLAGAEFGVYLRGVDQEDRLLTTLVTDEKGSAHFHANREEPPYWTILTNTLYYFKELKAPEGYQPLQEPYWFYFQEEEGLPEEELPEGNLYIEPVRAD